MKKPPSIDLLGGFLCLLPMPVRMDRLLRVPVQGLCGFVIVTAQLGMTSDISGEEATTGIAKISSAMGLGTETYQTFGSSLAAMNTLGASTEGYWHLPAEITAEAVCYNAE